MRVLFPLCGASVDLAWLYRQGHTVVGVEGTWKAVEKLFSDGHHFHSLLIQKSKEILTKNFHLEI